MITYLENGVIATNGNPITQLKKGDLLTYSSDGFFAWLVKVRTSHPIVHVESYIGDSYSIASRFKTGVRKYRIRTEGLNGIYRIKPQFAEIFDFEEAMRWFGECVEGQDYDYMGLWGFVFMSKKGDRFKQFCSELLTRWYRHARIDPVSKHEPAEKIAPYILAISNVFDTVWQNWRAPD